MKKRIDITIDEDVLAEIPYLLNRMKVRSRSYMTEILYAKEVRRQKRIDALTTKKRNKTKQKKEE